VATFGNAFTNFIFVLLILLAVAIASFGVQTLIGRRITGDVATIAAKTAEAPQPSLASGIPESNVFNGLKGLAASAANPGGAVAALATAKGAAALNTAAGTASAKANAVRARLP
jgi:hypothetical protein